MSEARVTVAAIVLGLCVRLLVVPTPFFSDGLSQMAHLAGAGTGSYAFQNDLDLFRFLDPDDPLTATRMAEGTLPWRFEDSQRVANFRPLASLLMAVDYRLFGTNSLLAHIHSFLWFLAFLFVAFRLYAALLPPRAARIALLATVLSPATIMAIKWWSARNAMLAAVFGAAGLLFHIRWQRGGGGRYLGLALGSLTLALLSCEAGLQAVALVAAYGIVESRGAIGPTIRRLAPSVALVGVYFVVRSALGYGVLNNALYVNPLAEPAEFAANVADKGLMSFGASFFNLVNESHVEAAPVWVLMPLLGALVVMAAAAGRAVRRDGDGGTARLWLWLFVGSILSLAPCFASRSTLRPWTFILPQLAMFALLASLATTAWQASSRANPVTALLVRGATVAILLVACVLQPARTHWEAIQGTRHARHTDAPEHLAKRFPPEVRAAITDQVERIVLVLSPRVAIPAAFLRLWYGIEVGPAVTTFTLSDTAPTYGPGASCQLSRIGPAELRLTSDEPIVRANDMFRYDERRPLTEGQRVALEGVTVVVGDVRDWQTADGLLTLPRVYSATFEFAAPLDERTLLLSWEEGQFALVPLPPPGESVQLPRPQ